MNRYFYLIMGLLIFFAVLFVEVLDKMGWLYPLG